MWEDMFADAITGPDVLARCDYDFIKVSPIKAEDGSILPGCCKVI